jgi:hypothetical protein
MYGCSGPTDGDCYACGDNAHWNSEKLCACNMFWGGDSCDIYLMECDSLCLGGCSGPTAGDCQSCISKAKMINSYCICEAGWTGNNCDTWKGECGESCARCVGPNDCI